MKRRWISGCVIVAGLFLLVMAGGLHPRLLDQRQEYLPPGADVHVADAPMVQVVTVALGGFRGLIADILWLRLSRLQEEGRYFELVQLARWITLLEPRIPEVWAYHAWNLTYNISVLFNSPEERWRWVRNGITLLRDEGLVANPYDAGLHWELGWFFQHKMGMDLDQMHRYYKAQWAGEMMNLLGGSAPNYEAFRSVPTTRAELLAKPDAAQLVSALAEEGLDVFALAPAPRERSMAKIQELLDTHPGAPLVLTFRNRLVLEQIYRLDLALMQAVDDELGPFDWRLPEAHAVYWAWKGLRHATGFDITRLNRMIYHNMAAAFRRGRLHIIEGLGEPIFTPNFEMLPRARAAFNNVLNRHPDESTMRDAHRYFLIDAALFAYLYMQDTTARDVFDELSAKYPAEVAERSFQEYVIHKLRAEDRDAMSIEEIMSSVEGSLYQSLVQDELGNERAAERYRLYARLSYDRYQQMRSSPEWRERTGLPPFPEMLEQARLRFRAVIEQNKQNRLKALELPDAPAAEPTAP